MITACACATAAVLAAVQGAVDGQHGPQARCLHHGELPQAVLLWQGTVCT